ncbi:pyridoxamine 5'-phosphate oxidase family protein [Streptomyces profundus]|uniref:pyridoxamine 5'-phosphate oxidase family protein n=1 Tax=Streptomyces profundus TaxID=2867410 RepID=UPI001D1623BA|nr:pyridoxamine 5'-phosphate oxidase family protein [Streptomyces sp. MA3_2.13]UED86460.1 pyridoxamine 5'-phosphate oxidase family protein [Streptomyces sp. MA3_2.13]
MAAEPTTTLNPEFSEPDVPPTPWATALRALAEAEIFWLSTVRPDGRPHVTPLLAIWQDGRAWFTTGPGERKAKNLAANPEVVLTTGRDTLHQGLDLSIEGRARRSTDAEALRRLADAYAAKYGQDWAFEAREGALHHAEGGSALLFELTPSRVFGFAKNPYSQTRWDFPGDRP